MAKNTFLREEKEIIAKGWLLDVMRCIEKIHKTEFTLADVYPISDQRSIDRWFSFMGADDTIEI